MGSLWSLNRDFKLEKGPTDKAKTPDPGGSDQQNLGYKKMKNRKTEHTVGLNYCISNISSGTEEEEEEVRPFYSFLITLGSLQQVFLVDNYLITFIYHCFF